MLYINNLIIDKMKRSFKIGCIIRKPQPPTGFSGLLFDVWTFIINDWLGFLGVVLLCGALIFMASKISLAAIILLSICLVISLIRVVTNKDSRILGVKIFNVVITIILLLSQILTP